MEETKDNNINDNLMSAIPADTPKRISSSPMIMIGGAGVCGLIENFNYTKNIKMFLEQEKLRMIVHASKQGITEETIEKLLSEQNVNDFYIENIKIRLGLVDKKPERVKKPVNKQQQSVQSETVLNVENKDIQSSEQL